MKPLDAPALPGGRVRGVGGGRTRARAKGPTILEALERGIAPETRGDPMSPRRWTCKGTRHLAEALAQPGSTARHRVVGEMLHHLGYSRPANATTWEGKQHPDRDAQSRYINRASGRLIAEGAPVISVGTQKEGRVGRYATAGREWQPAGEPEKVRTPDFPDPRVSKAIPSGISDLGWDLGWVTVGVDPETASLAVEGIRQGWSVMGSQMDPEARRSLIGADGGGSNGSRLRLWEVELPGLADETGLEVTVGHFPPGTSKWDQIEHRLSSHLPMNWRGRPRVSHQV